MPQVGLGPGGLRPARVQHTLRVGASREDEESTAHLLRQALAGGLLSEPLNLKCGNNQKEMLSESSFIRSFKSLSINRP
jgi:hypothetical protein